MDITKIKDPTFLKSLNESQLNELASDIRKFIIDSVSKTGGHLSSNLGIVELTIALHYVFKSPIDKIFFDVGHQCYVHKILTGRAKNFSTLRQYNGLSGFQKRCESEHDVWEAGHSSTALSAAVAMAIARDLDDEKYEVIPVIGDGAIVGGESLEALNHLGSIDNKVILILNDNQMSISKSTGAMNNFLNNIRMSNAYNKMKDDYRSILTKGKVGSNIYKVTKYIKDFVKHGFLDDTIFEDFGLDYLGPVDGHNINELIRVLTIAKVHNKSVVVHVVTEKGKGYSYAEADTDGRWHGTPPFDIETGDVLSTSSDLKSWSSITSEQVLKWMEQDKDILAITPAMMKGSAMEKMFDKYPNRCFDVGIAEEHALTFTAGLSIANKKPFISVYSSFIQRAYDQINHDIARMNLPCLCSIDRAGIVGEDGPTHHGVFDISILTPIPNIVLFAPKDSYELKAYINTAYNNFDRPYFLRIPRGSIKNEEVDIDEVLELGSWSIECNELNYDLTLICYGENVLKTKEAILKANLPIRLINARFIKPIDNKMVDMIFNDDKPIVVYETILEIGSLGSILLNYLNDNKIIRSFEHLVIGDHYSKQGTVNEILKDEKLDIDSVIMKCEELLNGKKEN